MAPTAMHLAKAGRRSPSPPIPSYDEATSSDATQRPLLTSVAAYRHASVESIRSSEDSAYGRRPSVDSTSGDDDANSETSFEGLRREVEDLDYEEADLELEELENQGNGLRIRPNRRFRQSRWKQKLVGIRRRVGRWKKTWSLGQGAMRRWQCPSLPESWRPAYPVIARLFGLFIVVGLGYALFTFAIVPSTRNSMSQSFDPEGVRQFAQGSVDVGRIRDYLEHITKMDHVAGSKGSLYLANWMKTEFWKAGMDESRVDQYYVYLNYPIPDGRRVAIIHPPELQWEAKLEEDPIYPEDGPARANTLVFHGHSRAGNVTGPLIYANYGSRKDFKAFYDSGIDINGTIALVRYYGTQGDRALKVKAAEEWGVKGVLMYSDPNEDGFKKGKVWPDGRWRPSDGVQRGSVSLMSWVLGDVLTPGHASSKDAPRSSIDNNPGLVNIPSIPLSWRDAQPLLQALKGHGNEVPNHWVGGVPDVLQWWSGNLGSPVVHLKNEQDENEKQPIFNVIGVIQGLENSAKKVIVGNHRDSWCFGAGDPGSGTAVMLEVIAILGDLRAKGWRPMRTIVFASWDAEEYNLIGSTEFVEEFVQDLRKDAVAYINVDSGVVGTDFTAAASPILNKALLRVLDRVADPSRNKTLREVWDEKQKKLQGLGAGSDYTPFQCIAGTSSIDFGFGGDGFPYHSCYETFEWMEKFGDPGFQYHQTLAQVWVLLILELSQELILPLNLLDYSKDILNYVSDLQDYAGTQGAPWGDANGVGGFDVAPLYEAAHGFIENAKKFHSWEDSWYGQVIGGGGVETNSLAVQRISHNGHMSDFETDLLDIPRPGSDPQEQHGIPGREQYKHVIFGPQLWSGYDEAYFPAIRDAIDSGNWTLAQLQLNKTALILKKASDNLLR